MVVFFFSFFTLLYPTSYQLNVLFHREKWARDPLFGSHHWKYSIIEIGFRNIFDSFTLEIIRYFHRSYIPLSTCHTNYIYYCFMCKYSRIPTLKGGQGSLDSRNTIQEREKYSLSHYYFWFIYIIAIHFHIPSQFPSFLHPSNHTTYQILKLYAYLFLP